MNLRELARGEPCLIRLPGICNFDRETTVLCHVRLIGISAMSLKAPDLLASWGCSACHDACDRSPPADADTETLRDYERRRAALLEGMARTQAQLMQRGLMHIGGEGPHCSTCSCGMEASMSEAEHVG